MATKKKKVQFDSSGRATILSKPLARKLGAMLAKGKGFSLNLNFPPPRKRPLERPRRSSKASSVDQVELVLTVKPPLLVCPNAPCPLIRASLKRPAPRPPRSGRQNRSSK